MTTARTARSGVVTLPTCRFNCAGGFRRVSEYSIFFRAFEKKRERRKRGEEKKKKKNVEGKT